MFEISCKDGLFLCLSVLVWVGAVRPFFRQNGKSILSSYNENFVLLFLLFLPIKTICSNFSVIVNQRLLTPVSDKSNT